MSQSTANGNLPTDWSAFYNNLQTVGNIPDGSCATVDTNNGLFSGMYVDLGQVKSQIAASGNTPFMTTIYADVLNIPDNLAWALNGSALFIIARRIQVGDHAQVFLDYRTSKNASLIVYASEVVGNLTALAVTTDSQTEPIPFGIDASTFSNAVGIHIDAATGQPSMTDVSYAQGVPPLQLPPQFSVYLNDVFIYASLLYDQNPNLALDLMTWTKEWSAQSSDLLGLFLRSTSMVALLSAQINAQANGAAFVPYLTKAVYTDLAQAFVDEAKQYESDYMTMSTQELVNAEFTQLAQTLLKNAQSNSAYVQGLKAQSLNNYNNALAAYQVAFKNFNDQQTAAKLIGIEFKDIGLPEYEREQIIKAIFSIVQAIVTFGVGIAAMLVGDEAAAPAAVEGAVEGVEAVEQAAEAGSEIAKLAKELSDVMEKLKKLVEGLKKVYELANSIMEAAGNIQSAESLVSHINGMDTDTDGADLSNTALWDIYKLHVDDSLATPVEKGIEYAKDYQMALDEMVIYGKALSAAQLAVVTAGQDYTRVLLQEQLAQQQQAQLEAYVGSLQNGEKPIVAMMQQFYQRYLDAKSSLFAALQGYKASYFYWALQPSLVKAQIISTVSDLDTGLQNLTQIAIDQQSALAHFNPPPSVMSDKLFVINDPTLITAFQTSGKAAWLVPTDDPNFAQLDRVRLNTVRVWLEGATSSNDISVNIKNSGNYLDRFQGVGYQFSSKPMAQLFQYRLGGSNPSPDWKFDNGQVATIELDGRVDNEVAYAYFQPTPFSEWTISVNTALVDVSKVTKITMEFIGSAIGEVQARRQ
jgi:hypothetical protein